MPRVIGCRRVPEPPARMMPFMTGEPIGDLTGPRPGPHGDRTSTKARGYPVRLGSADVGSPSARPGPRPGQYPFAHEGSRHGWGRLHRQQLRPPHAREPPGGGDHRPGRAHVRRVDDLPGGCDGPHPLRRGRRRRRGPRGAPGRRDGPRRPLRRRVPQRQLAGGPQPLRADEPPRHLRPSRGGSPPRRALPPHLDGRGLRRPRPRRATPVHREHPVQPELAVLLDEGRLGPSRAGLGPVLRAAGDDLELLEQLRPPPARGEVHPAPDHERPRRRASQAVRRRPERP